MASKNSSSQSSSGSGRPTGTLIHVDHGKRKTWHHSVEFDGYSHGTACGQVVDCEEFDDLRMDITEWTDLDSSGCCDECASSVRSVLPEMSDGGQSDDATDRGIYLAGPVENDDSPRSWRDELRERHPDVNWIDPMDWQDEWEADPEAVWERELETCRSGAILVVNIGDDAPRTTGTHHEIREALNHDRPVAIVPNGKISQIYRDIEDVRIYDDVDEAVRSLATAPELVTDGGVDQPTNGTERIAFADELVPAVLDEEKQATVRYDGFESVQAGDTLTATTANGAPFAKINVSRTATVLAVEAHALLSVFAIDYPSDTPQDVINALNEHYDDGIRPRTQVRVLVFEVVRHV